jgi:TolB-like protein
MTAVFVSYSRADRARIEPLVELIASTGAEVWWDDRLVAGETFSEEIERRLNAADFVVVAWSPQSVRSKWVLDEAAAGRDAGKLLPVSFDGQMAPIGFRQVHTTDFSNWSGGADEKCARALTTALTRKKSDAAARSSGSPTTNASAVAAMRDRRVLAMTAGALALVLAVVAGYFLLPGKVGGPTPGSIAVLPFADLSATKDKAYFAEGLAEEILSSLARDPALRVIGRTTAAQFAGTAVDLAAIRRALNVEHILEGSVRAAGGRIKISVALLRTRDGVRVWSEQYDRPEADVFAIESEVGAAVAKRLGGKGDPGTPAAANIAALDLLLEARQLLRNRTQEDALKARGLLEKATALDPGSASILGALSEAVYFSDGEFLTGKLLELEKARALAERAIALAPDRADGYAALSLVLSDQPAAQRPILEKAVALDPSRSDLRMWLIGHEKDSEKYLAGIREIIALDPLWHRPVLNLATNLVRLGRHEEAERAIADYAARAPHDKVNPVEMLVEIALMAGDFASVYKAYSEVSPRSKEADFAVTQPLAILGMDEKTRAILPKAQTPPDAWRRRDSDEMFELTNALPKFYTAIPYELLADHRRGPDILHLYDTKLGAAEAFCAKIADFGVERGAPSLIWALMETKRNEEAQAISLCAEAELEKRIAAGTEVGFSYFYLAQLQALAGSRAGALSNLRSALELNFRGNAYSLDLREYRAFDTLQGDPQFAAIQKRIDAEAARQRAAIKRFDEEARAAARKAG